MQESVIGARLSAMLILFSNGLLYATWGVSVPLIKSKFDASEAVLSLAMAAVALGGIVTMGRAGEWIAQRGSGTACVRTGLMMVFAAAPILLIPSYPILLIVLFVYGVATAANDVAANAQGAHLENLTKKSLIGSLHGSFSVGGLVGALLASGWAVSGMPPVANLMSLSAVVCIALLVVARHLQDEARTSDYPKHAVAGGSTVARIPRRVRRRLLAFGALAFCALVVEGAFYDWAAVYMREVVGAPRSWVGFGYAAFALGMAGGRLFGDWVRNRVTHQFVIAGSGLVGVSGLALILLNSSAHVAVVGFFVTGLGLSNVIPVLFSSAGRLSIGAALAPSQGLAMTTRVAYVGLLLGPLFIGPLANVVGLRWSFLLVAVAIGVVCAGWFWLSWRSGGIPWELRTRIGQPVSSSSGLRVQDE
ncbi:MFS transporter (plasmid) [Cupriavidus pinatubonensis]|uniref:MFS transporter n=1 Tax=Cupriavidus pinatubonensis TaxID=248026 RepID=UPI001C738E65|nr:MFS transporter [Cupriavidus pinatubonensis]QYY33873.1 MFS transporter [Cupriavidus pinatubonensis]